MILKPVTLLYSIIVVLVGAIVWEYYIQQWMSCTSPMVEKLVRVDLL
jgi:hypothetical protein